jgi:hypothetical protein
MIQTAQSETQSITVLMFSTLLFTQRNITPSGAKIECTFSFAVLLWCEVAESWWFAVCMCIALKLSAAMSAITAATRFRRRTMCQV